MMSTEDDRICDRGKKIEDMVCTRYCTACGACDLMMNKEDYIDEQHYNSDLYHTLLHRSRICPMYGPCLAGEEMKYDTCTPIERSVADFKKQTLRPTTDEFDTYIRPKKSSVRRRTRKGLSAVQDKTIRNSRSKSAFRISKKRSSIRKVRWGDKLDSH